MQGAGTIQQHGDWPFDLLPQETVQYGQEFLRACRGNAVGRANGELELPVEQSRYEISEQAVRADGAIVASGSRCSRSERLQRLEEQANAARVRGKLKLKTTQAIGEIVHLGTSFFFHAAEQASGFPQADLAPFDISAKSWLIQTSGGHCGLLSEIHAIVQQVQNDRRHEAGTPARTGSAVFAGGSSGNIASSARTSIKARFWRGVFR